MSRIAFENRGRVSAEEFEEMSYSIWYPPGLDGKQHIVEVVKNEREKDGDVKRSDMNQANSAQTPQQDPVSAEEMDDIRQRAYQEGLNQGRQEGILQGKQEGIGQGKEEGLAQGKEAGYQEGLQKGLADAKGQMDNKLSELNRLLTALTHPLNDQDYKLEQALLNLVMEISRQVIRKELQLNREHILKIVREALAALPPTRDNLRIFVHPDDLDIVRQAAEQGGENWRVVADATVSQGGCRVETEQSVLDYTLDMRFKQMIEQVLNKHLSDPQAPPFEEAPEPVVKPVTGNEAVGDEEEELPLTDQVEALQNDPGEPAGSQESDDEAP